MTTFDDKEKAAENKYAHDKEIEFKIHARAHKLLGLWAAGKMGLSGKAAEDYAGSIILFEMAKSDPKHLVEKIKTDFSEKKISVSDNDIRAEILNFERLAQVQILGE